MAFSRDAVAVSLKPAGLVCIGDRLDMVVSAIYVHQPIKGSNVLFNILAPGVQEWHLTGGLTHTLSNKDELSFAFMYSPQKTVTGPNLMSAGQSIDLSMTQFSLQFGWSRRF